MKRSSLLIGDLLALLGATVIGFITHGEGNFSFLPRLAAIYIPLSISWLLVAPRLRLFQHEIISNLKQLWRVPLGMLIVAPSAVVIRAWVLQTPVIPVFMLALGGTSALGLILWRGAYILFRRKS